MHVHDFSVYVYCVQLRTRVLASRAYMATVVTPTITTSRLSTRAAVSPALPAPHVKVVSATVH